MLITQCNSHPFTFYLPFYTSSPVDQRPIYAPSSCTMGLDTCGRHSLFGRTDPYYTVILYSSCGLNKRLAATLAFPPLCKCTVFQMPLSTGPYLGHRIPISLDKRENRFGEFTTGPGPQAEHWQLFVIAKLKLGSVSLQRLK